MANRKARALRIAAARKERRLRRIDREYREREREPAVPLDVIAGILSGILAFAIVVGLLAWWGLL